MTSKPPCLIVLMYSTCITNPNEAIPLSFTVLNWLSVRHLDWSSTFPSPRDFGLPRPCHALTTREPVGARNGRRFSLDLGCRSLNEGRFDNITLTNCVFGPVADWPSDLSCVFLRGECSFPTTPICASLSKKRTQSSSSTLWRRCHVSSRPAFSAWRVACWRRTRTALPCPIPAFAAQFFDI